MLPEKIRLLNVSIGDAENAGQLIRASTYEFRYVQAQAEQAPTQGQQTAGTVLSLHGFLCR